MKRKKFVKWSIPMKDAEAIRTIVKRALKEAMRKDALQLMMDLTATHANGCPLDLEGLANAKAFDFWHDIRGIQRHLNRDTGKLEDCFLPRYKRREH